MAATSPPYLTFPQAGKSPKKKPKSPSQRHCDVRKSFFKLKTRDDILWVGPVQGGRHLDLVASSAVEMGKLPFPIHALGSPTEVMENYRYDVLADMIINLPKRHPN